MKKKALIAYGTLLVIVFLSDVFPVTPFAYAIPLFLMVVPVVLARRINISLSIRHLAIGVGGSVLMLAPVFVFLYTQRAFTPPSFHMAMTQLFLVSFPEEVFFRGFLQDTLGNNLPGVVIVSLMFALAHLPSLVFRGDVYSLLTFFPSLVMGLLYMKTKDVLPSTVFHFLANVLFLGFVI